jgi:hypothetical protein
LAHLIPKPLLSSTPVCKHAHGCFENVIEGATYQFMVGLAFQMAIKSIGGLLNPKKLIKIL